jgi:60 kDa SS-A/Ro ribonucleoprotein
MSNYITDSLQSTQREKDRSDQVENNAGGYVFAITPTERFKRWLVLGSEGGTYYQSQRDITRENLALLKDMPAEQILETIKDMRNRVPKLSPLLFALAWVNKQFGMGYDLVPEICRTASQLFEWVAYRTHLGGKGSGFRRAIQRWYEQHPNLPLQLVKYRQRSGWTHRDLLRIAHPKPSTPAFEYIMGKREHFDTLTEAYHELHDGFELAPMSEDLSNTQAADIIRNAKLPWEAVPTELLRDPQVMSALIPGMPPWALLRQLGRMSAIGLFKPLGKEAGRVAESLKKMTGVHPLSILSAMKVYQQGHGERGSLDWDVNQQIADALEAAFTDSFKSLVEHDKNIYIGVDVSGSMTWDTVAGVPGLTPCIASGALAWALSHQYKAHVAGFTGTMKPLDIRPGSSWKHVQAEVRRHQFGRTDCALPMLDAINQGMDNVECFIVITDNETWCGEIHPYKALQEYRLRFNPTAKLAVIGMTSTGFSIADPDDGGMMDFVGFDSGAVDVLERFI